MASSTNLLATSLLATASTRGFTGAATPNSPCFLAKRLPLAFSRTKHIATTKNSLSTSPSWTAPSPPSPISSASGYHPPQMPSWRPITWRGGACTNSGYHRIYEIQGCRTENYSLRNMYRTPEIQHQGHSLRDDREAISI